MNLHEIIGKIHAKCQVFSAKNWTFYMQKCIKR